MQKLEEPMPFNELVDEHTSSILLAIIEGGGKAMKSAIYTAMVNTLQWRADYAKWERQNKKGKK